MRELFHRNVAIGIEGQNVEAPLIDGAATTVIEVEDDVEIDRRGYGGIMVRLSGGRGLFIGRRGASMAWPARYRLSFLVHRARVALARRVAPADFSVIAGTIGEAHLRAKGKDWAEGATP